VPKKKKLANNLNDHWPEIIENLDLSVVPIKYISSIEVIFHNGKIWRIDIEKSKHKDNLDAIEHSLVKLFSEYEDEIKTIDFKLDVVKIKKDIAISIQTLLKRKNKI